MTLAATVADRFAADVALSELRFLPPAAAPEKCICVGVNYRMRNAEYKDGSQEAAYPSLFVRFPGSLVGHRVPIIRPRESTQLDYEGEIVLILGKGGRRIPRERALEHIAGVTCGNEGSVRDWLRHAKFNVTQGKNFEASGSMGPWMTTWDELAGTLPLRVQTRVNAELRQDDTTANMTFDFTYLLSYISQFTALKPGDVIFTGTPVGTGARMDPPQYLKIGDQVDVTVAGVGTLSNPVVND